MDQILFALAMYDAIARPPTRARAVPAAPLSQPRALLAPPARTHTMPRDAPRGATSSARLARARARDADVLMGWSAALPPLIRDMRRTMDPSAFRMLLGGGLAYTLGVPVFVRNRNLDHVVWHAFVLAGSAMHFGAVWSTVAAALQGTL